jgi:hypothetical protein
MRAIEPFTGRAHIGLHLLPLLQKIASELRRRRTEGVVYADCGNDRALVVRDL